MKEIKINEHLIQQTDDEIRLMQYNPEKNLTFKKSDIQAVYAVVGRA